MGYKRRAVVAGSFYAADGQSLYQQIKECFLHKIGPQALPDTKKEKNKKMERKIMGVISPHAGFMFSGPVAAHNYLRLSLEKTPQTIIILGPNHRGLEGEIAIMSSGQWETPLGIVEVDQSVAHKILTYDDKEIIKDDIQAHSYEHSIEVQLPFLQFIYSHDGFKIVPICIINQQLAYMKYLAEVIYEIIKEDYKSFLLIASSDFTHYEDQETAIRKDREGIEKILKMDSTLFYRTISENGASICGPGPISIVIEVCKKLGIAKGQLLKYATSGDVSGIYDQVVGYASIIFQ
jgi:hypothetical protein